jgi:CRP/FNR family cyclic AMP-dependent transcriptional regulator
MSQPAPELLRNVPMFSTLDEPELERLAAEFRERSFRAGDRIVLEGDEGLTFFVIEDGHATVSVRGTTVAELGPGDHFGEIALADRGRRAATVVANGDVQAHMLPIWNFRPLVESNPDLAWKLLETLAAILRDVEEL